MILFDGSDETPREVYWDSVVDMDSCYFKPGNSCV